MFIVGAIAAFAIVVALSKLQPQHRKTVGLCIAGLGLAVIAWSWVLCAALLLAGLGLAFGTPLFEKRNRGA